MASNVGDLLKICSRNRSALLKILLQQSPQATELQCRPHVDWCSRCWMRYSCQKAIGQNRLVLHRLQFPSARGLRTLTSLQQKICKEYEHNGAKCCSDEWVTEFIAKHQKSCHFLIGWVIIMSYVTRAVPEFGSGSGRNPAIFANPADIRLRPKLGRILVDLENFR